MKLDFSNLLVIAKREEHEYKRVCARRLENLCSYAQISRLEEVLVDQQMHQSTIEITYFLLGKVITSSLN